MKIETVDGGRERHVLIGMITDKTVLGRIASKWKEGGLFLSPYANLVGKWCVDHFTEYNDAPGNGIESIFETWDEKGTGDNATRELVCSFLSNLSGEYERENSPSADYMVDMAESLVNEVAVRKLKDSLESCVNAGDIKKAFAKIERFNKIELGASGGSFMLNDDEVVKSVFNQEVNYSLIQWKDKALAQFFGSMLARNSFVVVTAKEKSGKSFLLQEISYQAILDRKKVAFFEVGDMTEDQIGIRFLSRIAKRPFESQTGKWPYTVRRPIAAEIEVGVKPEILKVERKDRVFEYPLDSSDAIRACQSLIKDKVKSNNPYFYLHCSPAGTMTVSNIREHLNKLELHGFFADIVVIDYVDLLAPPPGFRDLRDQINETWQQLTKLRQEKHCLVLSATQASASSYNTRTVTMNNFSNDKRKHAHVTAMIGINVVGEEKEREVIRLNCFVKRKGKFNPYRCLHAATCLDLCNPLAIAVYPEYKREDCDNED